MIGKSVSHYRIIEKIGSGEIGVVYNTRLKRTVCTKELSKDSRFCRLQRIDSGCDRDDPFISCYGSSVFPPSTISVQHLPAVPCSAVPSWRIGGLCLGSEGNSVASRLLGNVCTGPVKLNDAIWSRDR